MENTGTNLSHSQRVAFGIDPETCSLAEIFTACTHCLSNAVLHAKKQRLTDALKLSFISLRISRWGKATHIYEGTLPVMTSFQVRAATETKAALARLLALLEAEIPMGSGSESPRSSRIGSVWNRLRKRKRQEEEVMEIIAGMIKSRLPDAVNLYLPRSQRLQHYRGCIAWSTEQYQLASTIMGQLEILSGTNGLRQLSVEEQTAISSSHLAWTVSLRELGVQNLDPWMEEWLRRQGQPRDQSFLAEGVAEHLLTIAAAVNLEYLLIPVFLLDMAKKRVVERLDRSRIWS